jgi:hypothetical protein
MDFHPYGWAASPWELKIPAQPGKKEKALTSSTRKEIRAKWMVGSAVPLIRY